MYLKHTVAYIFPMGTEVGWYSAVEVTTSAMLRHAVRRSPVMARFVDLIPRVRQARRDVAKTTLSVEQFPKAEVFTSQVFGRTRELLEAR
jgi:hypothetical protein